MKTTLSTLFALLMTTCLVGNITEKTQTLVRPSDTCLILSSPQLYDISTQWASEFNASQPELAVRVIVSKQGSIAVSKLPDHPLTFMSEMELQTAQKSEAWKMVIGRDVLVPVINKQHPYYDEIYRQGIGLEDFRLLMSFSQENTWEALLGEGFNQPIKLIYCKDDLVNSSLNTYGLDEATFKGTSVNGNTALIEALNKDVAAIGLSRISEVFDESGHALAEGLAFLPFDMNNNKQLDRMENIYADVPLFLRSVWLGKYPKELVQNIYTLADVQPRDAAELAFLKWILTSGEPALNAYGYAGLIANEVSLKLRHFQVSPMPSGPIVKPFSNYYWLLIILGFTVLSILVLELYVRRQRRHDFKRFVVQAHAAKSMNISSLNIPSGVYFDKTHTWAIMEKEGQVRVGMDDFLQHVIGSFTRVMLKAEGARVKKGESLFKINQNGKQLTINAPISGTIKHFNSALLNDSSQINSAPYHHGWIYLIEPTNWFREIEFLKTADSYRKWLKTEFSRLKDFIASSNAINQTEHVPLILQDGGEVLDQILSELGPEVWDDFQTQFLDAAE